MQENGREYVTMQEFDLLRSEVQDLARSVNTFVDHSSKYIDVLLASATGRIPTQSISLETHNKIIKGLITAFCIIIGVAVGVAKAIPYIVGAVE